MCCSDIDFTLFWGKSGPVTRLKAKIFVSRNRMRTVIQPQLQFGETQIADIVIDPKSRDDIPQFLRGLQYIDTEIDLRQRVFALLEEMMPDRADGKGKARKQTGRPGGAMEDTGIGCAPLGSQCRLRPDSGLGQPRRSGRCSGTATGWTNTVTNCKPSGTTSVCLRPSYWIASTRKWLTRGTNC